MVRRHHLGAGIAVTRGHAVNAAVLCQGLVQEFSTGVDFLLELGRAFQFYGNLAFCDGHHLFDSELSTSNYDLVHFNSPLKIFVPEIIEIIPLVRVTLAMLFEHSHVFLYQSRHTG